MGTYNVWGWRSGNEAEERANGAVVNHVEAGEHRIELHTDRGLLRIDAEGDCCSESFFLNFEDANELVGKVLTSISGRPEEDTRNRGDDPPCRQERSIWYGLDVGYVGGVVYLEMRNDSNGYYGGSFDVRWVG